MSCNDILEKLEKEGIISAEGVIDSYLLCKHAEELFGKSYLKEHNIVLDDDKKEAKICKKGDLVECWFEGTGFCLLRVVRRVEQVRFKDLKHNHAWFEGYRHVDLLKHELQCIYPDMWNNTVLFQIKFKHPPESEKRL